MSASSSFRMWCISGSKGMYLLTHPTLGKLKSGRIFFRKSLSRPRSEKDPYQATALWYDAAISELSLSANWVVRRSRTK